MGAAWGKFEKQATITQVKKGVEDFSLQFSQNSEEWNVLSLKVPTETRAFV